MIVKCMLNYNNCNSHGYLELNGLFTDIDELSTELLRNLIMMITEENNIMLINNNFFIDNENNFIPYLYDKLYVKIRQNKNYGIYNIELFTHVFSVIIGCSSIKLLKDNDQFIHSEMHLLNKMVIRNKQLIAY